jgi:hypothetical protein
LFERCVDVCDRGVDARQLARRGGLRDPLARLDGGRLAVDADVEVRSGQAGDRIAAIVGDARVDQDPLDGDLLLDLREG